MTVPYFIRMPLFFCLRNTEVLDIIRLIVVIALFLRIMDMKLTYKPKLYFKRNNKYSEVTRKRYEKLKESEASLRQGRGLFLNLRMDSLK
jgi:hypothetical protein